MCDDSIDSLFAAFEARNEEQLVAELKRLRNLCAQGPAIQEVIVRHDALQQLLHSILFDKAEAWTGTLQDSTRLMAWQLLANAIVSNEETQKEIWARHGESILQQCPQPPIGSHTDIQLMIVYNIFKGDAKIIGDQVVLQTIVAVWQAIVEQKCEANFDFLHFLYEHFLVNDGRTTVRCYAHFTSEERTSFLDYIASYLRHDSPNGLVNTFLLHYFAKEFKIKSDCILRQTAGAAEVAKVHPREAYALLRVIAGVSGSERYAAVYAADHSLFLNVSSVLRCLVAVSKETKENIFTPMNKLENVATGSNAPREFEAEISYELKTLLVRCVANLLYNNPTNQNYCADTQLMAALFECTNMDARNPLMKEWSILAIRNACVGCKENQAVIENLTKEGEVQNDLLAELNLEMGSLRIHPSTG